MNRKIAISFSLVLTISLLASCAASEAYDTRHDISNTKAVADNLVNAQPTPTDINYSLERYNLIKS